MSSLMDWYDTAAKELRLLESKYGRSNVDGAVFLRRFFQDGNAEKELSLDSSSDDEEIEDAVRKHAEGFEAWLIANHSDWIAVESDFSWQFIDEVAVDAVESTKAERESKLQVEFSNDDKLFIEAKLDDENLTLDDINTLKGIYRKIENTYFGQETAHCARLVAFYYGDESNNQYETTGWHEIAIWWERAANTGKKIADPSASHWYAKAALIHYREMNHHDSARLYGEAYSTGEGVLDNDELLQYATLYREQLYRSGDRKQLSSAVSNENELRYKCSKGFERFTRFCFKYLSNHGESPLLVVFWAAVVIFLSAFAYYCSGISPTNEHITKSDWTHLYFSLVTFTTLGYGDFVPASSWARVVASAEAISGLLLTSLFLATFLRKYSR